MMTRTDTRLNEARIYTMRQLNQDTAGVLEEVAEAGTAAFVTRRGRFVARITPIPSGAFEASALARLIASANAGAQYTGEYTADGITTSEQIRESLVPSGPRSEAPLEPEPSRVYTMRQLSHGTAAVLRQINDSGQTAIVTRHGRVLAVIAPLVEAGLEQVALSAVLERVAADDAWATAPASATGTDSVAEDLDVRYSSPRTDGQRAGPG